MINVIFITSLSIEDLKIFKFDDLYSKIDNQKGINCLGNYNVQSSTDFINLLKTLESIQIEGNLFLQINMHGNPFGIGFVDESDIIWSDFDNIMRNINQNLFGNLYLFMAVCYGLYFKSKIKYPEDLNNNKISPFRGILASKTPVYKYEVDELFTFYKFFSEKKDIEEGIRFFLYNVPTSHLEYQDLYKNCIDFIENNSSLKFIPESREKELLKSDQIKRLKKFFIIN